MVDVVLNDKHALCESSIGTQVTSGEGTLCLEVVFFYLKPRGFAIFIGHEFETLFHAVDLNLSNVHVVCEA